MVIACPCVNANSCDQLETTIDTMKNRKTKVKQVKNSYPSNVQAEPRGSKKFIVMQRHDREVNINSIPGAKKQH